MPCWQELLISTCAHPHGRAQTTSQTTRSTANCCSTNFSRIRATASLSCPHCLDNSFLCCLHRLDNSFLRGRWRQLPVTFYSRQPQTASTHYRSANSPSTAAVVILAKRWTSRSTTSTGRATQMSSCSTAVSIKLRPGTLPRKQDSCRHPRLTCRSALRIPLPRR